MKREHRETDRDNNNLIDRILYIGVPTFVAIISAYVVINIKVEDIKNDAANAAENVVQVKKELIIYRKENSDIINQNKTDLNKKIDFFIIENREEHKEINRKLDDMPLRIKQLLGK